MNLEIWEMVLGGATMIGLKELIHMWWKSRITRKAKTEEKDDENSNVIREMLEKQLEEMKEQQRIFMDECREREDHYEEVIEALRREIGKLKTFETEVQLKFNTSTQALKVALSIISELKPEAASMIESLIDLE